MYLLTPPTVEPVTVAELKLAARLDDTRFDAVLPGLIAAAREMAQQETGRQFIAQTWRLELSDWPAATDIFPIHRATACSITYWSGSAFVALSGAGYVYHPACNGTSLVPALNTSWPALGSIAGGPRVRIDLTAGDATAANVPECVKTYIKAIAIQMMDNPGQTAASVSEASPLLARMLDSVRLWV
jgi:uncharacterized phiE125 gp8 family phage protein